MSKIRTSEEIQQYLEQQRLKLERRKEIEKQRKKREKAEKAEARKKREARILKEQNLHQNNIYIEHKCSIQLYHKNIRVGRYLGDEELYQTWEEIRDSEEKENARINWDYLPKLIEETRKLINGKGKTKRR